MLVGPALLAKTPEPVLLAAFTSDPTPMPAASALWPRIPVGLAGGPGRVDEVVPSTPRRDAAVPLAIPPKSGLRRDVSPDLDVSPEADSNLSSVD